MATVMDGKALSKKVRARLKEEVATLVDGQARPPCLAVVLVGQDPASQIYVRRKHKACEKAGVVSRQVELPEDTPEERVLMHVRELAEDPAVDGILVQLPLPPQVDADRVLRAVPVDKDVDGFHPDNLLGLVLGDERVVPCTPKGILALLEEAGFEYRGSRALVIGRSRIVGKPMAYLLTNRHATVTVAHSRTEDLEAEVRRADLVVAAVGVRHLVRGEWVREGAFVVDVGIHRSEDGALAGDVEYEAAAARAGAITPVPGGVGPMTIAMLIENTVEAYRRHLAGGGKSG